MEYAGALAGAALGHIHMNTPGMLYGAYYGYRAGIKRTRASKRTAF